MDDDDDECGHQSVKWIIQPTRKAMETFPNKRLKANYWKSKNKSMNLRSLSITEKNSRKKQITSSLREPKYF